MKNPFLVGELMVKIVLESWKRDPSLHQIPFRMTTWKGWIPRLRQVYPYIVRSIFVLYDRADMKERFKAIVGVFAVFREGNKILLARRCNTEFANGLYSLPAGHLESGESLVDGMIRELEEEVGVRVETEQLRLVHVQSYNAEDGHRIHFYFQVVPPYSPPQNMEPDKCDDLSWFSLDALPEKVLPYVRTVVERMERGEMYTETAWD